MRRDPSIPRGEVHRLVHKSEVLQANPLGDPTTRDLIVWTPPDWKPSESLPLLVDLKGYWSSALAHANWSPSAENVPERLDRLAQEGMARAIVVFPDCFTKLFGNQYLNSAGSGRYADYICDEIVPMVELQIQLRRQRPARRFRQKLRRLRRGVARHASRRFLGRHLDQFRRYGV